MKSTQEAFTKIVLHLRKQGAKSLDTGACVYRGENGRSGAIGCIIADEHYTEAFEGATVKSVHRHGVIRAISKSGWDTSERTLEMLCEMQTIHDSVDVHLWEGRFAQVAKEYNLELPPL